MSKNAGDILYSFFFLAVVMFLYPQIRGFFVCLFFGYCCLLAFCIFLEAGLHFNPLMRRLRMCFASITEIVSHYCTKMLCISSVLGVVFGPNLYVLIVFYLRMNSFPGGNKVPYANRYTIGWPLQTSWYIKLNGE